MNKNMTFVSCALTQSCSNILFLYSSFSHLGNMAVDGDHIIILQKILLGVIVCTTIANCNLSKFAYAEVGFHQYAEIDDPTTILKMPFNAIINFGYVLVGIYWLKETKNLPLNGDGRYYLDVFSMMSIAYGPVQFLRIVTQHRLFAILDQWFTLPIFAWASLIGNFSLNQQRQPALESFVLLASVSSYGLALICQFGFEAALGLHILFAVLIGITCQLKAGTQSSSKYLVFAVLSCFGFVFLKINDHQLGRSHWIFKRLSGHFLSKICDILQINFVVKFFIELLVKNTKVC